MTVTDCNDAPSFITYPHGEFLRGHAYNFTSQYGEDGLIHACLAKFGVVNRWCFEVGAADGEYLSNTKVLRNYGWDAVLIEADEYTFGEHLSKCQSPRVRCIHKRIKPEPFWETLDWILQKAEAPEEVDFGVIDVDGPDYWILESLKRLPRMLLIEFNAGPNPVVPPKRGGFGQAGIADIEQLAHQKGYKPLSRTGCNLLCVKNNLTTNQ